LTRGFHDPRAHRQVLRSQGRIAHPVAMLTKIGQRFMESLPTRVARPQATQRSHHGLDSLRRIAPYLASRLDAFLVRRRSLTIGRPQRGAEMLRSMREIENLLATRQQLAQVTPVVRRSIGHFDDA
jgi:hypothetical protein